MWRARRGDGHWNTKAAKACENRETRKGRFSFAAFASFREFRDPKFFAQTAADREMYQRQIDATDTEIDALVYALYGLTEEEIRIVEGLASKE